MSDGDPAVSPSESLFEWSEKLIQKSTREQEARVVANHF